LQRLHPASLSATTPGEGQVSGQGEINLRDGVGTELKIQARGAIIIDTDLATATIDSDRAISGNLQARLKLGGEVKVMKADSRLELTRFGPSRISGPAGRSVQAPRQLPLGSC
jgi:autotransporter translocation and assembly factor TamB